MDKYKKAFFTLGIIGIFTFIVFPVAGQAEQFECLLCAVNMTTATIVESTELTVMGYEGKGIVLDNSGGKFFDNDTVHSVGIMKIDKGKVTGSFVNKHLSPNGDFYVLEGTIAGSDVDWKFIYGTGKFKGISGGGKSIRYTKGRPVTPGATQLCSKVTGNYELKK